MGPEFFCNEVEFLTQREKQLIEGRANGADEYQLAQLFGCSVQTVKNHFTNIRDKWEEQMGERPPHSESTAYFIRKGVVGIKEK